MCAGRPRAFGDAIAVFARARPLIRASSSLPTPMQAGRIERVERRCSVGCGADLIECIYRAVRGAPVARKGAPQVWDSQSGRSPVYGNPLLARHPPNRATTKPTCQRILIVCHAACCSHVARRRGWRGGHCRSTSWRSERMSRMARSIYPVSLFFSRPNPGGSAHMAGNE